MVHQVMNRFLMRGITVRKSTTSRNDTVQSRGAHNSDAIPQSITYKIPMVNTTSLKITLN